MQAKAFNKMKTHVAVSIQLRLASSRNLIWMSSRPSDQGELFAISIAALLEQKRGLPNVANYALQSVYQNISENGKKRGGVGQGTMRVDFRWSTASPVQ